MKTIFYYVILTGFLIIPDIGYAQLLSVSGYVRNIVADKVIENATIYENESGVGTITNNEGYYKLLLKPGKQHLTISNPGFEDFSRKFVLSSDTIITISMKSDNFKQLELAEGSKMTAEIKTFKKKSSPKK